jgi:ZIP family zinc transporter
MNLVTTVFLGAIAGFTIYLGLPVARLRNLSSSWQAFLNALATGILIFLFWDVISKADQTIGAAMDRAHDGSPRALITLLIVFVVGLTVGLMGLVYFERRVLRPVAEETRSGVATPVQLALMIAIGIGAHNFSEGLAIGQAARTGALALATILIIGFGLHNATEGFGIAAPLTRGEPTSWGFVGLAGLIGGGPTFLGTILGVSLHSDAVFVLFLSLAAGSILWVVAELLHVGRGFGLRELTMWGVLLGFLAGYGTDLILTWAGA